MESRVHVAGAVVRLACTQIRQRHALGRDAVIHQGIRDVADELSSCPEFAVQSGLAVAEPSVAEDFGVEATHLEQCAATNRHVDTEEDSVVAQLKAAAEVHQAQTGEHSRIGLHEAAQPRWR